MWCYFKRQSLPNVSWPFSLRKVGRAFKIHPWNPYYHLYLKELNSFIQKTIVFFGITTTPNNSRLSRPGTNFRTALVFPSFFHFKFRFVSLLFSYFTYCHNFAGYGFMTINKQIEFLWGWGIFCMKIEEALHTNAWIPSFLYNFTFFSVAVGSMKAILF
jgi:hypothetical protein